MHLSSFFLAFGATVGTFAQTTASTAQTTASIAQTTNPAVPDPSINTPSGVIECLPPPFIITIVPGGEPGAAPLTTVGTTNQTSQEIPPDASRIGHSVPIKAVPGLIVRLVDYSIFVACRSIYMRPEYGASKGTNTESPPDNRIYWGLIYSVESIKEGPPVPPAGIERRIVEVVQYV
ncbi:hypothetical protein FRC05_007861 [Tulasnella sp. 425]|nr:hypothetical protein FRC05_007861 [Tulasnella sp. 425]